MTTCKDCIHYDVCRFHITEETTMSVAECSHFKNKEKLVDVEKILSIIEKYVAGGTKE